MTLRLAICLAAALVALPAQALAQKRERFDTRVLALVPKPGFPAHAYVHPNGRIYEGTYDNPSGDTVPSRVFEFEGSGDLLRSWTVEGQNLSSAHGVQAATSDVRGRLVLLDKSPPRVLLLDRGTGVQSLYASFRGGAIPNYAAWGPDGSLYVTDYAQPILWRIPPGGGEPVEWLSDPRLDGDEFGQTGLNLAADRKTLLVAVQSSAGGAAGNPSSGRIYKVPIGAASAGAKPGQLQQLWESRPGDGPDGFAIARSGTIYIALLVSNQIAVIGRDGKEIERFPSEPLTGSNGSSVPFDAPSSARFLGTRLIVAQQAYISGDPTRQAILDVETGEAALAEFIPRNAGLKDADPPRVSGVRIDGKRVRFRLGERATVTLRAEREDETRRVARKLRAGLHSLRFRLVRGRWRVTLSARDAAGNAARTVKRTVRVR